MLAGLLVCQVVLLGSSLWGSTILLPLDILAEPGAYIPRPASTARQLEPKDNLRSDLVYQAEVWRRFVVEEVRAGRLPLWNPYNYCGHPLLAADQGQVFSPYRLLDYACPSPVALAWSALLRALVGGVGTYRFFRRAVGVTWLPAALGAWAFPLTGTMVLSSGYAGAAVVSLLPWMLWAADAAACRPAGRTVTGLAITTACTLLAGHSAYAGQVLLAAGIYFVARMVIAALITLRRNRAARVGSERPWNLLLRYLHNLCRYLKNLLRGSGPAPHGRSSADVPMTSVDAPLLSDASRLRDDIRRRLLMTLLTGVAGFGLGFMLSAPQTLPLVDYMRSSLRVARRFEAAENIPAGPQSLIQLVLPYAFGSSQRGSTYIGGVGENRIESAAGGYAGLMVAIVFAPLGWADPRRRRQLIFWAAVFVMTMTPTVGIPLLRQIFLIKPISLLRNNRLVFAAGFALMAMGVIGLDVWVRKPQLFALRAGKRCIGAGAVLATAIGVALAIRGAQSNPAAPGGIPWRAIASHPAALLWPDAWADATGYDPNGWFGLMALNGVMLCAIAGCGLLALSRAARRVRANDRGQSVLNGGRLPFMTLPSVLAALAVAEMVSMGAGVNVRANRSLYYPRLQWMDRVAASPGRICGVNCLPANLNLAHRIPDIRGYDAADPLPLVELLILAQRPPQIDLGTSYAVAQTLAIDPGMPGPVADLLGVRYLVGRGDTPAGVTAIYRGQDYWLAENPGALPRATIPRGVQVIPDREARLHELAAPTHRPAEIAILEKNPAGGISGGEGQVKIVEDLPDRVRLDVDMTRPGLVRLADAYDAGWRATWNGHTLNVFCVDHALRGVVAPAGHGVIEFRYEPRSFSYGLILAAVAFLLTAVLRIFWRQKSL